MCMHARAIPTQSTTHTYLSTTTIVGTGAFGKISSSKRGKCALLIGCNYPGTQAALAGCVNDVQIVHELLVTYFGELCSETDETAVGSTAHVGSVHSLLAPLLASQ